MLKALLVILLVIVQPSAATATGVPDTEMRVVDDAGWQQQLKTYRGRILVVDMWATWCSSCIERFPKIVDLDKKYRDRGVQVISLNLDDRDDHDAIRQANRFLNEVGAVFPNYHMNENMMRAFERLQLIGIPVVIIYDAHGQERFRMTGDNPYKQFTDQDVDQAIKLLLDEKK